MKRILLFLVVLLPFLAKSQTVITGKYKYTDSLTFAKYKNNSTLDSVLSVDQNGRLRLSSKSPLDTTSLSNRIDARVKYTDTANMLIPYLRKADTTGKWLAVGYLPYLVKYTDTAAFLSAYYNKGVIDSKLALKLNISDTANMLAPYLRSANLPSLAPYVKYADTSNMLNPYLRSVNYGLLKSGQTVSADSSLLSTKLWRQKGIDSVAALDAQKVKYTDTATMLSAYYNKSVTDSKLALKVNYTDTASMLSAYYNKTATNALLATKLSSVALTMPSAFTVSNSPLTSNGTIAVTGAGTTAQYIRGDGSLASYNPGAGGGGASQVFYFNGGVSSSVSGYQQMSTAANTGASSNFSVSSNGYIASFLTDEGSPNQLNIPAGNWNFEIYMNSSSFGGSPYFYVELYKYDGSTFTLISSSSANPEYITNGTTVDLYTTALTVPATTLFSTDRLAVRVYVVTSGRTITMHTQDSNLSEVITTFTTGITALNGLTAQVQNFATGTSGSDFNISSVTNTHTFNIPTASATNRGLLSSANWTTFNNKVNISDTSNMLNPYLRATNYGLLKSGQTVSADSSLLSTKLWRQKGIDSVAALDAQKVKYSDTATMLSAYYRASNPSGYITASAITGKVNYTDTASMLSPYLRSANAAATYLTQTTAASTYYLQTNPAGYITSSAISGKVNYTDTASMLSPYSRDYNTVHKTGTETITGDKTLNGNNGFGGVNTFNTYQTRFEAGIALNNTTSGGAVGSHTVIGANTDGLQVNLAGGGYNNLKFASTTIGNSYTFPNATGTLALTSDIPSITGKLNISDTAAMLSPYKTYYPRAALSFTAGSGAYNNSTGVITIPTNTNQLTNGAGFISSYTETDPVVRAINGIVKSNGTTISAATAGTDYVVPSALNSYLPLAGGTLTGNTTINYDNGGLTLNRSGVTQYTSINFQNAGVNKWYLAMRENEANDLALLNSNTSTEIFRISSSTNNFGIGASTPNARLSLGQTSYSSISRPALLIYDGGTTAQGGNGYFAGFSIDKPNGNDFAMTATNAGAIVFNKYTNNNDLTNVTEFLRINNDGNIVQKNGTSYQFYKDNTPTYAFAMGFSTPATALNNDFTFANYNGSSWTERLHITSGGNVLIGTTTDAGYKLDVNGTGRFTGALTGTSATFTSGTTGPSTGITSIGDITTARTSTTGAIFLGTTGSKYLYYDGTKYLLNASPLEVGGSVTAGNAILNDASYLLKLGNGSSSNNASIGLFNNGGQNLEVLYAASGKTTYHHGVNASANAFYIGRDGTYDLVVNSSGNVGIGTTSPSTYGFFVVNSSVDNSGVSTVIRNSSDVGGNYTRYAGLDFMIGSDNGTASIRAFRTNSGNDYQTALTFWTKGSGAGATSPTERIRITSSGILGFNGSSSPGNADLDKMSMGYLNSSYGWIQTWAGTPLALNPSGNNVLIGTTTDNGYKFQVNGSQSLSGALSIGGQISQAFDNGGIVMNRSSTSTYSTIQYQTGGAGKWYIGMRENNGTNDYITYSTTAGDVLRLNQTTGAATFGSTIQTGSGPTMSFVQKFAGTPTGGGNVLSVSINGTTYYIQLYTTTL